MSKYQFFEPGKYFEWEKPIVEERIANAARTPENRDKPIKVSEYELLHYNDKWDPYNPFFNDKEYARKAGYPDVFAFPCFITPMGAIMTVSIPQAVIEGAADGVLWRFAHGPNDVEFFAPIYPGDTLTVDNEKLMFEELTLPGSDLRHFRNGCVSAVYNQKGELVMRHTLWRREAYRQVIDGSPVPSTNERMLEQRPYSPAHYTTDDEWEYIKELWRREYIRGGDTLFWEDVNVGDEPVWVCSGPVSYMDMMRWHGDSIPDKRAAILNGATKYVYRDMFGQYLVGVSPMYGCRNIPGSRAILYNNTAANIIARLVTNYIGDTGFVTRIGWMFKQTYPEMRYPREGGEYLDKVPYMKGKACTEHPTEGDTVIGKGYVTDKYVNDRGEHVIELVCWGETLDRRIIEVVPAAARLPSRAG